MFEHQLNFLILLKTLETGWSFWISTRGKYAPEYGNYNFDFVLADGHTKIGFHDFGPQEFPPNALQVFTRTLYFLTHVP